MDQAANFKNVEVLCEEIFSEDNSPTAGKRRFVVRLLRFADTNTESIGISRQWFDTVSNTWLPAKKGHVYFPRKTWHDLTARIAGIDHALHAAVLFDNGSVRANVGRVGHDAQGLDGRGYAPNGINTITATAAGSSIDDAAAASSIGGSADIAENFIATIQAPTHVNAPFAAGNRRGTSSTDRQQRGGANGLRVALKRNWSPLQ
jgi:hypothetical protein